MWQTETLLLYMCDDILNKDIKDLFHQSFLNLTLFLSCHIFFKQDERILANLAQFVKIILSDFKLCKCTSEKR